MRKSSTLLLGAALALATVQPAFTQVPVTDAAVTASDAQRNETTKKIDETDNRRHTVSKSVTCSMYRPGRGGNAPSAAQANPEIVGLVKRVAREEGVDETLFMSLVYQESRFNPCAKSPVGATGLSQLMPGTAKDLGVSPHDIEDNLRGGARYLKQQLRTFKGDTSLALAAYNAGPGNVRKYGGIPPFKETQGYVAAIKGKWMPQFGGSDVSNIPENFGGGSAAFSGARDATINSMATTQSISENSGNIGSWLQQLGQMESGTIQDSWDHNSGARNANLEMMNQVIRLGASMAELMNSQNALDLGSLSGSSRSSDYKKDEDREVADLCDNEQQLQWDPTRKACVKKLESQTDMKLMLSAE
jgi:hypothetical protein